MDPYAQIIAFIRLNVWETWLRPVSQQIPFVDADGYVLGNGRQMLCVSRDTAPNAISRPEDAPTSALYLLVPDGCPNWNNFRPSAPFKYLYHSQTTSDMYDGYWELENCIGSDGRSHEESDNEPYYRMAEDIKRIARGADPNPGPIWDLIPDKSWIDEQKHKLLMFCAEPSRVQSLARDGGDIDSNIKKLVKWDNDSILDWIKENEEDGRIDFEEFRQFLHIN